MTKSGSKYEFDKGLSSCLSLISLKCLKCDNEIRYGIFVTRQRFLFRDTNVVGNDCVTQCRLIP